MQVTDGYHYQPRTVSSVDLDSGTLISVCGIKLHNILSDSQVQKRDIPFPANRKPVNIHATNAIRNNRPIKVSNKKKAFLPSKAKQKKKHVKRFKISLLMPALVPPQLSLPWGCCCAVVLASSAAAESELIKYSKGYQLVSVNIHYKNHNSRRCWKAKDGGTQGSHSGLRTYLTCIASPALSSSLSWR